MKTRQQIVDEILQWHEGRCKKSDEGDYYKNLAEEQGQDYVDKLIAERDGYFKEIEVELAKRLTEESYLTCEDFDHFDVTCCDTCHTCYPHDEMWIVVLSDGRHAWVCDSIKHILMRQTDLTPVSPETEKAL